MDHTMIRDLIGVVEPWDHYSSNDLGPNSNNFDRQMYVSREHIMYDDGNSTTNPDDGEMVAPAMSLWHTLAFIMTFFFVVLLTLIVKDGLCKYCGLECCQGQPLLPHSSQHPLEESEWQGLTPEEIKERRLEKQRLERRLWYSYFLKPYLTVLTAEHFRTDDKKDSHDNELEEGRPVEPQSTSSNGKESILQADQEHQQQQQEESRRESGAMCVIDVDDLQDDSASDETTHTSNKHLETNDDETTPDNQLYCQPVGSEESDFCPKMMTLWDPHDTTFRQVEASCTICLLDYEEGDTIVRSAADEEEEFCIHVFHLECMLQWLAHGRKRCPICRHWFVPAIRIKEQMKQAHVVTRSSLHHLYDSRTMQDVISLSESGETESDMSRSFHTDDTAPDIERANPILEPQETTTQDVRNSQNPIQEQSNDTAIQQTAFPSSSSTNQPQTSNLELPIGAPQSNALDADVESDNTKEGYQAWAQA